MFVSDLLNQFPHEFPLFETVVSALVAFALGTFWYHPKVMGDKWTEAHITKHNIKLGPLEYFVGFVLWLITASVYSFLTQFLTPPSVEALLGLSTFLWVGFVMPSNMISGFYSGHRLMITAIDSSYYLAGLYLFAVIHDVL